jgi:hypothetical protein
VTNEKILGIDASAPAQIQLGATVGRGLEAPPNVSRLRRRLTPGRARTIASLARRFGCGAAIVGMFVGAFVAAAPVEATVGPGYTLSNSRIVGEAPGGFKVYVSPLGSNHASLAVNSSRTAYQLGRYGLQMKYVGYGTPAKVRGIITVTEGSKGCSGSTTTLANTVWYYASLPLGGYYMYRSDIVVCPSRYARLTASQRLAVIRHEMGHAIGLGHTNYSYAGSYQIMNAYLHSGVSDYKAGDVAGIRRMVSGSAKVRSQIS